jgi:Flp pilus assembly protein TadD
MPILLLLGTSGCRYLEPEDGAMLNAGKDETPSTFGKAPESIWLQKAKDSFRSGDYGLAERYYRQAIEERHSNAEAWLGLAASYDRLKRFDLADRAYKTVGGMIGNTPTFLNNLGYHYMLKGDFKAAENAFLDAQKQDPSNPYIKRNLALLSEWREKAGSPS